MRHVRSPRDWDLFSQELERQSIEWYNPIDDLAIDGAQFLASRVIRFLAPLGRLSPAIGVRSQGLSQQPIDRHNSDDDVDDSDSTRLLVRRRGRALNR
jgi:hypothetical protein